MSDAGDSLLVDVPALLRTSEAAAAASQRAYFRWLRAHLVLLAATAVVSAWSPKSEQVDRCVSGIVAVLMFSAFILGLFHRISKFDERWFRARAIAENTKAAMWRFVMKPKPADPKLDDADEKAYLAELRRVRERFQDVDEELAKFSVPGEEITAAMRRIRTTSPAERAALYSKYRVNDQIDWYGGKAKANAVAEGRWFRAVLALESIAIIVAAARVVFHREYNPTGVIAAVAACLLAWSQARRFADLANTYGVAHRDLIGVRDEVGPAPGEAVSEDDLAQFVRETESTVSREHRLWVDRRI